VPLHFSDENWDRPETVTVTGFNDYLKDGHQSFSIKLEVDTENTTDTTGYLLLEIPDVSVVNIDNDTSGLSISQKSGITTEKGGADTFTIKLNSPPDEDVVIDLSVSDDTEAEIYVEVVPAIISMVNKDDDNTSKNDEPDFFEDTSCFIGTLTGSN